VNTFKLDVPVEAGDLIGLNDAGTENACEFMAGGGQDITYEGEGDASAGETISTATWITDNFYLPNATATLLAEPKVTSLGTTSGPVSGGTSVTISGAEFAEVLSVKFGSTSATYTVDSETEITAKAPAGAAGEVPVTVTTLAGSATATQRFTYAAASAAPAAPTPPVATQPPTCTVPSVTGLKLKEARERVKAAHCALGKNIRKPGANNRNGKVVAQTLKAGIVAPLETVVRVTLRRS
jgi:hypothetical protein